MQELLRLLAALPKPFQYLLSLLLLGGLAFLTAKALGIPTKWAWFFVLGVFVIILIDLGVKAVFKLGEKRRAKDFEDGLGLHSKEAGVSKEEIREALAELSKKWEESVRQLREAGMSIYSLPWYLLIGEPQSGKSTTLKNSGLEFPVGDEGLSGAGGTRNCDWWFSNEAVILDTAGRFTFQEESAPDQHEWSAFLKLLRRGRKYCPINGVIVVIPATSLVEDATEEQERKAKNIRAKLLHLQKALEIRFPIFVLVTKADRLLGFTEFFNKLDPTEQRQLFGWSNPELQDKAWDAKKLGETFEEIVTRVHKLRLKYLNEEPNLSQVDKMFVFPEELEAIQEPLQTYLQTMFASSRYEEPFIFRGFYITSGVQQGRPIARACRDLLRVSVGDPEGVLEDLEQVFHKARAFFIRDFYEKKAFQEQGLVTRTRAALKRDKVNRGLAYGLGAVIIPLLVGLLVAAAVHLYGRLKPINDTVSEAKKCLSERPCSVRESWALIERIEQRKRELGESRLWMRIMLQGGARNEITGKLLPAIQAQLFRNAIMAPLLASFDARAARMKWAEHEEDYEVFYQGLASLLRCQEHRTAGPDSQERLRAGLRIAPVLGFCRQTKGLDATSKGAELDDWLAGSLNTVEVEDIFRAMLAARHELASVSVPEPAGVHRAFRAFWRVDNLGRWNPTYYFRSFADLSDELGRLDANAPGAQSTLTSFADLAGRMAETWQGGEEAMKGGRSEAADRRPGREERDWVANCRGDYQGLLEIAHSLAGEREVASLCDVIPDDWERKVGRRDSFTYLFTEKRGEGAPELAWSDEAGKLKSGWVDLGKLARPAEVRTATEKLTSSLSGLSGASARFDEITSYSAEQERMVNTPAAALRSFADANPNPRFDARRAADRAGELASLALAMRVLPPVEKYLSNEVFRNCGNCYTPSYAKDTVPAANKFLNGARRSVRPVSRQEDVARLLASIDGGEVEYLRLALRLGGGGGGAAGGGAGGGGGGLVCPSRALRAEAWSEFVSDVRQWEPEAGGGGAGGNLNLDDVQAFARDNDALRPLLGSFGGGERRGGPSEELTSAAKAFRRCVGTLEDSAREAWRQLATKKDGASLADFHAFTRSPALRSDRDADLCRSVEERGSQLLAKEIRRDWEDASGRLWSRVKQCCTDKFPFITERALERQRDAYGHGPQPGAAGDVWGQIQLDSSRREASAVISLATASQDDLDRLFDESGDFAHLFSDFALGPIVDGEEQAIDFLGADRDRVRVMGSWQRFLFPERAGEERRGGGTRGPTVSMRLLSRPGAAGRTYLGERVSRVDLFGPNTVRPANPTGAMLEIPLAMDERPLVVAGVNEDRRAGWNGRLEITGGPLKLLYFVLLAADGRPTDGGRVWTVRIEVPDFERPDARPEGLFEVTFAQPLPGVFPSLESRD